MPETKCFVETGQDTAVLPPKTALEGSPSCVTGEGQETLRVLAIGSLDAVNSCVRTLYRLGYASPDAWSLALPTGNPGEVMRILTKRYQP